MADVVPLWLRDFELQTYQGAALLLCTRSGEGVPQVRQGPREVLPHVHWDEGEVHPVTRVASLSTRVVVGVVRVVLGFWCGSTRWSSWPLAVGSTLRLSLRCTVHHSVKWKRVEMPWFSDD